MSAQVNRRTFIGLASGAALGVTAGMMPARAQSAYVLTAEVVTIEQGFQLNVMFALASLGTVPLFVQIADSKGADVFFSWTPITSPSDTDQYAIGINDVPYGRTYLVSIVDSSGVQDPLSPVVEVAVPGFPDATFS